MLALTLGLLRSGVRVATYGSHDGADAMIEINMTNCTFRRDRASETTEIVERANDNTSRHRVATHYRAASRLDFRAAYRVIDLSNNSEARSDDLNYEVPAFAMSRGWVPDFPSDQMLLEQVYEAAVHTIASLFVEKVEERSLVF